MVSRWGFFLLLGTFFVYGHAACPTIISRAQWGARSPVGTPETLSVPVPYTVIHHGGTSSYCTTQTACATLVRAYQNYDIDTNGWNDIGYNFVVGEDGNVYEGRGWNAVGAHAVTYNTKSIGIAIIGDFTNRLPNQAALNAVKNLIQCGVDSNKIQASYKLIGHRQNTASSTDCPGNALYNEIKTWPHWTSNSCPTIISRAQWGARPPKTTPQTLSVPVPYSIIHHGESSSCTTQSACAAIVRSYQTYHMDSRGWNDIGYNFVVGEDGNVYEGRGWNAVGAHAAPYNSNSIGICIIGSFKNSLPNQAARNAVKNLIECGVNNNKIQGSYKLLGHRQASSTDCPGNALYNEIKTWPHWATSPKSVNGVQIAWDVADPINDGA